MFRLCGRILARLDGIEAHLKAAPRSLDHPLQGGPVPATAETAVPGLPAGSVAPVFELPDLDGVSHSLTEFRGKRVLLVFFSSACPHCRRMADLLSRDDRSGSDLPTLVFVSMGAADDLRAQMEQHGLKDLVLRQKGTEVSSRYRVNGTPMAYLVDADGTLATSLLIGMDAVLSLATGKPVIPAVLPIGNSAPEFELSDLDGRTHSLKDFSGRRVLLIFFSPHCGFCIRMADDLARILIPEGNEGVLPVLVSSGTRDENRSMVEEFGLRCPLLLQGETYVSAEYLCPGTPMGYLIDEQGRIASIKTSGAEALLRHCQMGAEAPTKAAAPAVEAPAAADRKPCAKCNGSTKPCRACEDEHAAESDSSAADALPYSLVQFRAADTVDAMFDDLLHQSRLSLRMVVIHGGDSPAGVGSSESAALRRFLRQHSDWVVAFQPTDASRFIVLSRDPSDRKALPSILTKAANFAKALSLHVADGASKVTTSQMEQRLEICTLCDRRSGDHCSACGCDLPTKAGWKTTTCPLNKWPVLDHAQVLTTN
jgi:peroxiredoxin